MRHSKLAGFEYHIQDKIGPRWQTVCRFTEAREAEAKEVWAARTQVFKGYGTLSTSIDGITKALMRPDIECRLLNVPLISDDDTVPYEVEPDSFWQRIEKKITRRIKTVIVSDVIAIDKKSKKRNGVDMQ